MANLNETVRELREWKRIADEAAGMIDALTDAIKAEMTAQETDTLTGPDWKVTWKNVNSTRIDSKALKADHADIYAAYSKTSTTRRFVLV